MRGWLVAVLAIGCGPSRVAETGQCLCAADEGVDVSSDALGGLDVAVDTTIAADTNDAETAIDTGGDVSVPVDTSDVSADTGDMVDTEPVSPVDGGCADRHVLIYPSAGCDGSVAPVCVDQTDTACLTIVCGCDGVVHYEPCEGSRVPWSAKVLASTPGIPCGDAGVDASSG
jgi:hypothetical protein